MNRHKLKQFVLYKKKFEKNLKKIFFEKKSNLIYAYNTPRPPMSVHKKFQPHVLFYFIEYMPVHI